MQLMRMSGPALAAYLEQKLPASYAVRVRNMHRMDVIGVFVEGSERYDPKLGGNPFGVKWMLLVRVWSGGGRKTYFGLTEYRQGVGYHVALTIKPTVRWADYQPDFYDGDRPEVYVRCKRRHGRGK